MFGCYAQQPCSGGVGAFQPVPVQGTLGVFVVQQLDEPFRRGGRTQDVSGDRGREVLTQPCRRILDGRSRAGRLPGARVEQQVEGERDPVAGLDPLDLGPRHRTTVPFW